MVPNIVVLTDFSLAAERARAYAAVLAAPLDAELHLVHVFLPVPVVTEYGLVLPARDEDYVPETCRCLRHVAETMPVPTTAEVLEADWLGAIAQAREKYQPMLIVAGLTATNGFLDEWFSNRAAPLPRQTGCPLLLVPEHLPDTALHQPRRLALAVEDRPFRLAPAARVVAPLLEGLDLDVVAVTVLSEADSLGGWHGLRAAQHSDLTDGMASCGLHKVVGEEPGPGILEAVHELEADLVALLDRGHGLAHKVFIGSVIDYVLRRTPVPVLLLSAHIPALVSDSVEKRAFIPVAH
ncbi:universal stress protein [Microvirga sp. STS02]|uniref:universal stress protein n=1 Tax=Hymenobacter negativus TaxID=2795026 RepID=UPI0018DCE771|nr:MULTISPECIES: universal stress protein [Bacteria]MBH8568622.1 universal stress protein [Hymenobacter negativus]MBR7208356.1 universal stress protein [Microvirga sp. STS02]